MKRAAKLNKNTEKTSNHLEGWRVFDELEVVICAGPVLVEVELVTTPAEVAED